MKKNLHRTAVWMLVLSLLAAAASGCGTQGTSFDTETSETSAAEQAQETDDQESIGDTEQAADATDAAQDAEKADAEVEPSESSDAGKTEAEENAAAETDTDNGETTDQDPAEEGEQDGTGSEESGAVSIEESLAVIHELETTELPAELPAERSIYDEVDLSQAPTQTVQIDPAVLSYYTDGNEGDGIAPTLIDNEVMKICIIGDSQFGNFKYYDGMAYLLSQYCKADVYNLAIGGATAAIPPGTYAPDGSTGNNVTGIAMVDAMTGKIPTDFLKMYPYVYNLFNICDFNDMDIFVVEYGVNDYLSDFPISNNARSEFDIYSYRAAIGYITNTLQQAFPDSYIYVCSPGYAQFFSNGTYVGDSNLLSNNHGTLFDYVNSCNNIVTTKFDYHRVGLMNPYYMLNVTAQNAYEYLLDGIHMNRAGREQYAQLLARLIIRQQGYYISEGANPLEEDWASTKQ